MNHPLSFLPTDDISTAEEVDLERQITKVSKLQFNMNRFVNYFARSLIYKLVDHEN